MNQKLLIVLAVSANDGVLAERLCDHIYRIHGKKQVGHLLIVANPDLHKEQRDKIRITAEMAFESVTETVAPAIDKTKANSKFHQLNNLFRHAALTAQTNFRWPWFWLEPDCVPVAANWIERLAEDYDAQPKKYMGLLSKAEKPFMARCGVYYPVASYELDKLCQGDAPFPLATAEKVVPSASDTDLVQYLNLETPEDLAKISAKAVVVHGDKLGLFAENWKAPDQPMVLNGLPNPNYDPYGRTPRVGGCSSEEMAGEPEPMHPQEIAKEINDFLEKPKLTNAILEKAVIALAGSELAPRLTRRQIRELQRQSGSLPPKGSSKNLDCVATEGCKSSIAVVTP